MLILLNSSNIDFKNVNALDILTHIGNSTNKVLNVTNEKYYLEIILDIFAILKEQITNINDFRFSSKLDEVLLSTIAFKKT